MGQLFSGSGLTAANTALLNPQTGDTEAVANPRQILAGANQGLQQAGPTLGGDVTNPSAGYGITPQIAKMFGVPANSNPGTPTAVSAGSANPNLEALPFIGRPSVKDAAQAGTIPGSGMSNPMSPGLSKGGKLLAFLQNGLQGALAGHAAQEQAILESGGRRAGGAGLAFQAGLSAPYQRALQSQQVALGQAGLQPVQTPYGQLPAALAVRSLLPWMIRGQAMQNVANIGAQSRENAAQTAAQARVQAAQIGSRFKAVPGVGLFDSQAGNIIPGTQQGVTVTPELAQDYGLPQDFVGKPMTLANLAALERVAVMGAPTTTSSTNPETGLTTTSTRVKNLPFMNSIASPAPRVSASPVARFLPAGGGPLSRPASASGTAGAGSNAGRPLPSMLEAEAQRVASGLEAPSQIKRASAVVMKRAGEIYKQQTGQDLNPQQAEINYKNAGNMMVGSDSQGRQIAGTPQELQKAGINQYTKLDGAEAAKVIVARQLTSPGGLFDLAQKDLSKFKPGELEALAPRWNEFLAGKVGTADPRYIALRTHVNGLLATALMQAHVGARGGEQLMEHFEDIANTGKMSMPTLKAALDAEKEYVDEKAMRPQAPIGGHVQSLVSKYGGS